MIGGHVCNDHGRIFKDVDTDQGAVFGSDGGDESYGAAPHFLWPLDVPPETEVFAVSSCYMETAITLRLCTGIFVMNEMRYWTAHVDPLRREGRRDEFQLPTCRFIRLPVGSASWNWGKRQFSAS